MKQDSRLPERLKEMLKAKGLTQRDMARYLGLRMSATADGYAAKPNLPLPTSMTSASRD